MQKDFDSTKIFLNKYVKLIYPEGEFDVEFYGKIVNIEFDKEKGYIQIYFKTKNGDKFDECLHTVPYSTKFRIEKSTKQEYSKRKSIENKLKDEILSSLEEDSKENTNFEIGFRYYPKKSKKKKN